MLNAKKVNESVAHLPPLLLPPSPCPSSCPCHFFYSFPLPYSLRLALPSLLPRVSATNRTWMCNQQCGKRMRACGMWQADLCAQPGQCCRCSLHNLQGINTIIALSLRIHCGNLQGRSISITTSSTPCTPLLYTLYTPTHIIRATTVITISCIPCTPCECTRN